MSDKTYALIALGLMLSALAGLAMIVTGTGLVATTGLALSLLASAGAAAQLYVRYGPKKD